MMVSSDTAKVLRLIAEGYPVKGFDDRYIVVQNPDYEQKQDMGASPCFVLDIEQLVIVN